MDWDADRSAFIRDVTAIDDRSAEAFTGVLDDLIAWSRTLDWAIEFRPRSGSQKVVRFVFRGTSTPFWTAYPGRTEPTKFSIIDNAPPTFPGEAQSWALRKLNDLTVGQPSDAKWPSATFEALRSPDKLRAVKSVMRQLLTKLSPQRTRTILTSNLPAVVNGKTWLGHDAESGAGRIDMMLINGATRAEMEGTRGAVDQHLRHLRVECMLPIRMVGDHFAFDRRALRVPAVVIGSVNRLKAIHQGVVEDVELRIYGRNRVVLPFADEESTPVTLRIGRKVFDATYHASLGNTQFTYLYQTHRKGTGGQTLGEFLREAGYGPGAKVELVFDGTTATILRTSSATVAPPPQAHEASDLEPPSRQETTVSRIVRDTELARRVKAMHEYQCQVCGQTIELPDGMLYAEAHHIQPLGEPHNGYDFEGNVLCVCPNHHAELDFALWDIEIEKLRTVEGHAVGPEYVRYHNEVIRKRWS